MIGDRIDVREASHAKILAALSQEERARVVGFFDYVLWSGEPGESDIIGEGGGPNLVMNAGKNLAFNTLFAGSSYSVTGPFMGLVSSVGFSAYNVADTLASKSWDEAGGTNAPTYTAPRKTCAFSGASAGAISLSAALNFAITSSGTVKGAFIVLGSGAVSTIDNTSGSLWSAGNFTGGDQPVVNGNTLAVSYTASM